MCAAGLLGAPLAHAAPDGIEVEAGGGRDFDEIGAAATFDTAQQWNGPRDSVFKLRWQARLQEFRGNENPASRRYLTLIGAMPVIRWQPGSDPRHGLFMDAGLGVNLISHTVFNDDRRLSTAFQFGEVLGVGLRFGERGDNELSLRAEHVSNADIKKPNQGLTYGTLNFSRRF